MRYVIAAFCALALGACAPAYKGTGQAATAAAYQRALEECEGDGEKLSALNQSARRELFDDCMAAQGFVRTN
ncbi:MAG TPA: hypothetical protein VFA23_11565 [Dongiaceae bacterium]|nr:hypothetical protein [Dongiaceae bacterium]